MKKLLTKTTCLLAACIILSVGRAAAQTSDQSDSNDKLWDLYESIRDTPDSQEKWEAYTSIYDKLREMRSDDWELHVKVAGNMALMLLSSQDSVNARTLLNECQAVLEEPKKAGDDKALLMSAQVHINAANTYNSQQPERISEWEQGLAECEAYDKKADRKSERYQEWLADKPFIMYGTHAALCTDYVNREYYDKAIAFSEPISRYWAEIDEEAKNQYRYVFCMSSVCLCKAAAHLKELTAFRENAKAFETFLADVALQLKDGKLQVDAQTQNTLGFVALMQSDNYSLMGEYDRCEEMATLGVMIDDSLRSIANYMLCKALLRDNRVDDAEKLHSEVLKDQAFVDKYLQEGDEVAEMLKFRHRKAMLPGQRVDEGEHAKQAERLTVMSSIMQKQTRSSGGRITLEGYRATITTPAVGRDGRVILPIDKHQTPGVGINFRIGGKR